MRHRRTVWIVLIFLCMGTPVHAAPNLEVIVEGVEDPLRSNVLGSLSIEQRKGTELTETQIRRLHGQAPRQIRDALEPLGYYRASVEDELLRTESGWKARYRIEPGTPIRVSELDIQVTGPGADQSPFQELVRNFPLAEGDVLHQGQYQDGKKKFWNVAANLGYFEAEFTTSEIRVDLEEYVSRIRLNFRTGPRFQFGSITFKNGELEPSFLRRFLIIKRGDPYSNSQLLAQQDILLNSEYFRQVEVKPLTDQKQDQRIPVRILLTPRKKHNFTFGVGFGTNTGPRLRTGYELRRVNRMGHRFNLDAEVSILRTEFTSRYRIPLSKPRTDQLAFRASWTREDPDPSTSRLGLLGVSRSRQWGEWLETLSLELRREDFDIGNQSDESNLLVPGWRWTRTRTDDPVYPNWGYSLQGALRGAHENLASDASFLQVHLEGKWIHSFAGPFRTIVRGEGGATSVDDIRELPPTVRFFAGGDQSVRGYSFNELGPENADGDVIGGKHLLVGSAELQYRFLERWSLAAFYDIGNALEDFTDSSDSLKQGTGVGVRWRSPVGPVRLDLAVGVDKPGNPLRVHLVIGPEL